MRTAFWFALILSFLSPLSVTGQREKLSWDDRVAVEKSWPNAIKSSTGLRYIVLKEGIGDEHPEGGDTVSVLYQGRLLNGSVFGESKNPAKPFQVRVGRDGLIPAWE